MRIGILTFHRAHNYGAVLQCYALQSFLCQKGYDVSVIDYNKKELWDYYRWFKKKDLSFAVSSLRKAPKRCIKLLLKWSKTIPRYHGFRRFQTHKLYLCSIDDIWRNPFNLVLIGSDQIWNTEITQGFDPFYWGAFERPLKTKVATYAASLKRIWRDEDCSRALNCLNKLDAISVREASVADTVHGLDSRLTPILVPDPVFLLTSQEWKKIARLPKINDPYVFFYQAVDSEDAFDIAYRIAKEKKKGLVVLSANVNGRNSDECRGSSPEEFIGWILSADLVVTSSFHATAFSIIFKKDFYSIDLNLGEDSRLKDILQLFQLSDRFISSFDGFNSSKTEPFDCQNKIESLQNDAIIFIQSCV